MKKILSLCLLIMSCATVDIEKNIRDSGIGRQDTGGTEIFSAFAFPDLEPEVIYVERHVFVPEAEAPPRTPAAGEQSVRASNSAGIIMPKDYSHAAMIYEYNPDMVYEVYAQPLRVCDITLQPGELAVDSPFVSDSDRWILGAGVNFENGISVQHIYVKPISAGLEASLIINTDRRVYRIILRSFGNIHMPIVRWRYTTSFPQKYITPPSTGTADSGNPGIDPRFLSFNYRVTYSLFKKPYWLPELVFDDGSKTYITFPPQVLQRELPAVFENKKDILNYRVVGNLIVIDKLIENISVKVERTEITIVKKKG